MTETDDPEEFREKWYDHADELRKLKLAVPPEQMEDCDRIIAQIKDLVDSAAAQFERPDADDEE